MQQQWKAIKTEINGEIGLSSRKFHELWPHMLIHYSDEDEYADILRLVVIALLIPTDTSECERLFSLMMCEGGWTCPATWLSTCRTPACEVHRRHGISKSRRGKP